MRHVFALFGILMCCAVAVPARGQAPALTVRNGDTVVALSAETLLGLPRRAIEARDEREVVKYDGIRLIDVLTQAGVTFGQTLRGPRLASYIVAGSPDGYRVVIALAEIDPDFANRDAIVADRRNGSPLSPRDGPLQLIIPADTHHARWVRNLATLTVQSAP
jgi:hypothetical protein